MEMLTLPASMVRNTVNQHQLDHIFTHGFLLYYIPQYLN